MRSNKDVTEDKIGEEIATFLKHAPHRSGGEKYKVCNLN